MDGMLWATVIVATVISLGALAYVLWPLAKPGAAPVVVDDDRLTELVARKDAVLRSIGELDFDYRVGKLSDEDYQRFDARLRRQAIGLIQQIDILAPLSASLDDQLEMEIAQLRKTQAPGVVPAPAKAVAAVAQSAPQVATADGQVQEAQMVVELTQPKKAVTAVNQASGPESAAQDLPLQFCTNCGNKVEPHHRFCANCGTPVERETMVEN